MKREKNGKDREEKRMNQDGECWRQNTRGRKERKGGRGRGREGWSW